MLDSASDIQENSNEEVQSENIVPEVQYEPDAIDHKVTAYFGENLDELRQNISGENST